jgi:enoyl-CoA hydratase
VRVVLVKVSRDGDICTVTIDRPQVMNPLNAQVLIDLEQVLDEIAVDDGVTVVVITGAGDKSFVAGADIAEMRNMSAADAYALSTRAHRVFAKLENLPQPTIAAVNGFALGGGTEVVLSCDIRIASDRAKFSAPEVSLGITPGFGGTQRLPRAIGSARALELMLTGRMIDAQEAAAIGLVNRVVPHEQLWEEVLKLARSITANGKNAVRLTKRAVRAGQDVDVTAGCEIEASIWALSFDEERTERMTAFLEKRKK